MNGRVSSIVSRFVTSSGAGSTHESRFPWFRSVSPDDRGEGVAGSGPEPEAAVGKSGPAPGAAVEATPAAAADPAQAASPRERVEEALRRRRTRGTEASDSPRGGDRPSASPPAAEPSTGEHWSRTVRRRVADGRSPPASGATDPPGESGSGAGEAPGAAEATDIRDRVERRLQEAEDRRRRSAGPLGASPRPVPAAPRRGIPGAPGADDAPARPEDTPDWDSPWVEEEEAAAPTGEVLPARTPSRLAAFIATCAFIGRVPIAPGTAGAVAGLVAFLLTRNLAGGLAVALLAVAVAVGLWAGARHAKDLGQPDPRSVVVDEFCGMWLALVGTNPSVLVIVAAFAAFRFLDIVKPPPVRQAERLPGGIGIMADDLVAGGIVRVVLLLALGM